MPLTRRLGAILLPHLAAAAAALLVAKPSAAQSQRPVVVIPGILGSKLADARGEVAWGDRGSLGDFGRLDLDPAGAGPEFGPAGLVERIRVLGPFWTVHAYEDLLAHLRALGFRDGETLFPFPYDWRQSNHETARRFDAWAHAQPALRDGPFDIEAHSMGGIVAKVWMLEHGGARRVRKAIYLGPPFLGSMNALATLTEGWGAFANRIAGGIEVIRHTMLSFPAVYELFPHYPRSCRLGDLRAHEFLDIFDPAQWNARDWLPPAYRDGGPRAAAFRSNLRRAERLADLADPAKPQAVTIPSPPLRLAWRPAHAPAERRPPLGGRTRAGGSLAGKESASAASSSASSERRSEAATPGPPTTVGSSSDATAPPQK